MQDLYLMPDSSIKAVPAGSAPPAGGTLVGGPSYKGNSTASLPTPTPGPTSTAINPTGFSVAAASPSAGTSPFGTPLRGSQYMIPVWRGDGYTTSTPFVSSGPGSANAVENALTVNGTYSANSSSSANAVDNARAETASQVSPQLFSEKDAYNEFASIMMDPKKYKEVTDAMVQSGWINPGQTTDAVLLQSRWNDAVRMAVDLKQLKGVDMTPLELVQMWGQNSGAALLANQNYVRDHLTGTRIQNDSTIDEKTPSETTLHDLLGRNPTDAELIAYNHGVEQTAAANPLHREIQTHYVQGQPDAQTITYTGGYDQHAAEMAAAQGASPEVAQNQAATTYYNALVNALRAAA